MGPPCGFFYTEVLLNKEQIKHIADILKEMAIGQFVFFGGKNIYQFTKFDSVDWFLLACSAMIYLALHVIIHIVLSLTEE